MNAAMEVSLRVFANFNDEANKKRNAIVSLSERPEETMDLLNYFEQNIHLAETVFHEELKKFGFMSRQEAEIAVNLMRGGSIYGRETNRKVLERAIRRSRPQERQKIHQ